MVSSKNQRGVVAKSSKRADVRSRSASMTAEARAACPNPWGETKTA
jgi:hypothetical protein